MPKLHMLNLDTQVTDYTLICIHTTLEDYRLAYYINKVLGISLNRRAEDLDFNNNKGAFSLYEYNDKTFYLTYNLIANKHLDVAFETSKRNALFYNTLLSETKITYLIDDKKKVDYFLKISGDVSLQKVNCIIEKINSINQVITSYATNPENIKQNAHLIF